MVDFEDEYDRVLMRLREEIRTACTRAEREELKREARWFATELSRLRRAVVA